MKNTNILPRTFYQGFYQGNQAKTQKTQTVNRITSPDLPGRLGKILIKKMTKTQKTQKHNFFEKYFLKFRLKEFFILFFNTLSIKKVPPPSRPSPKRVTTFGIGFSGRYFTTSACRRKSLSGKGKIARQ